MTFGSGKVGNAVVLDATSLVAIPDAPTLSPSAITVEAWIQPTQLPASRMGIFDNNNSYGFFVLSTGGVRCTVNVAVEATPVITQLGAWTYVACTYDGTTARLYVDGAEVAVAGGGTALGTGDTSGSVLGGNSPSGDPFVGAIDQVRVFSVARTADEVCIAAGRTPPC
ncbi:MAG TPA: LamG domain-containing protein [Kofleriaceae bacterium]|nr:LamG domain-containing protein [Kofleriaceae bacterium]